jgi:hypothetical protein
LAATKFKYKPLLITDSDANELQKHIIEQSNFGNCFAESTKHHHINLYVALLWAKNVGILKLRSLPRRWRRQVKAANLGGRQGERHQGAITAN